MTTFNVIEPEEELETELLTCSDCKEEFEELNTENRCDDCADNYFTCKHCDEVSEMDDAVEVNVRSRSWGSSPWTTRHVCEDCCNDNFTKCYDCSGYFPDGEMCNVSGGHSVCPTCRAENYYSCEACGTLVYTNDVFTDDDDGYAYCSDACLPSGSSDHGSNIHDWSYKPRPKFLTLAGQPRINSIPFFGIELEVENGSGGADYIDSEFEGDLYCKNDGSLDDGFEIVTHPATYEYHMSLPYASAFTELRQKGYRSHDVDTCGLHIHISRHAFGCSAEPMSYNIARFIYMTETFYEQLFKLSRRTFTQMNQWAKRYGIETDETPDDVYRKATSFDVGRYHLVNLENENTIEVRAFRGTLIYSSFIGTLQFVKCLFDIATDENISVNLLTWEAFKSYAAERGYDDFRKYCDERNV